MTNDLLTLSIYPKRIIVLVFETSLVLCRSLRISDEDVLKVSDDGKTTFYRRLVYIL